MLSQRRQKVLAALIEEYVAKALPVASRALADGYDLGVSSATVRNELSVLEDDGYILQPYTSAGRIPTDNGYRSFVDDLLRDTDAETDEKMSEAIRKLRDNAKELDELMEKTSNALTRLTDCLSIVLPPSALSLQVKRISLISMHARSILMVVVTEEGRVLNRTIEFAEDIDEDAVSKIKALMNQVFSGKSFVETREQIDEKALSAFQDPLTQILLSELFACLQENETGHLRRIGLTNLMKQPEFSNSNMLVPLLQRLEDDSFIVSMADATKDGDTVVKIGHENGDALLENVSLVATHYGRGDKAGIVAVIGPTRMDYDCVIRAVRAVQRELQDV